ncbi:hypothetical protein RSSM_04510 [Rhodopirellula sallentina SM41]|uniref:Uncharacterized protein n=1 Tax=Rhodopirellula sallentina SM41 TaxID=1263870 RepID=M5TYE4_9BACT|nr:hypothetical protein RSSM_04510 [Rhodopirellula sallentina SM41]
MPTTLLTRRTRSSVLSIGAAAARGGVGRRWTGRGIGGGRRVSLTRGHRPNLLGRADGKSVVTGEIARKNRSTIALDVNLGASYRLGSGSL